jgi:hypothetical protein
LGPRGYRRSGDAERALLERATVCGEPDSVTGALASLGLAEGRSQGSAESPRRRPCRPVSTSPGNFTKLKRRLATERGSADLFWPASSAPSAPPAPSAFPRAPAFVSYDHHWTFRQRSPGMNRFGSSQQLRQRERIAQPVCHVLGRTHVWHTLRRRMIRGRPYGRIPHRPGNLAVVLLASGPVGVRSCWRQVLLASGPVDRRVSQRAPSGTRAPGRTQGLGGTRAPRRHPSAGQALRARGAPLPP